MEAERARRQRSHPFSVPSVPLWFLSSAHALLARAPQEPVVRSFFTGSQEVLLGALRATRCRLVQQLRAALGKEQLR